MALCMAIIGGTEKGSGKRAEDAWRWVCRVLGAVFLCLLVLEEGFKGPVYLYVLFAGLMTLGDVFAEAFRVKREIQELRRDDDDRRP